MKGSSGKAVQGSRFIIVKICIPDLFWGITLKKMMLKRELKDFPPQKQWGNIPNKVPGDIFIIHCKQVPTFQGHLLQEEMTWAEHASCLFLPGNERMRGNGAEMGKHDRHSAQNLTARRECDREAALWCSWELHSSLGGCGFVWQNL